MDASQTSRPFYGGLMAALGTLEPSQTASVSPSCDEAEAQAEKIYETKTLIPVKGSSSRCGIARPCSPGPSGSRVHKRRTSSLPNSGSSTRLGDFTIIKLALRGKDEQSFLPKLQRKRSKSPNSLIRSSKIMTFRAFEKVHGQPNTSKTKSETRQPCATTENPRMVTLVSHGGAEDGHDSSSPVLSATQNSQGTQAYSTRNTTPDAEVLGLFRPRANPAMHHQNYNNTDWPVLAENTGNNNSVCDFELQLKQGIVHLEDLPVSHTNAVSKPKIKEDSLAQLQEDAASRLAQAGISSKTGSISLSLVQEIQQVKEISPEEKSTVPWDFAVPQTSAQALASARRYSELLKKEYWLQIPTLSYEQSQSSMQIPQDDKRTRRSRRRRGGRGGAVKQNQASGLLQPKGAVKPMESSLRPSLVIHSLPVAPAGTASVVPGRRMRSEPLVLTEEEVKQKLRQKLAIAGLTAPRSGSDNVHVFVDMSNIWLGFCKYAKFRHNIQIRERSRVSDLSFSNLAMVLERDRTVRGRLLVGSVRTPEQRENPPYHFTEAEVHGYQTKILLRVEENDDKNRCNRKGKGRGVFGSGTSNDEDSDGCPPSARFREQAVDENIHLNMLETILVNADPSERNQGTPGIMVLATGDGNIAEFSKGFRHYAHMALARGWRLELVAWSRTISSEWKGPLFDEYRATGQFRIIELDEFFGQLYAKDSRQS